MKSILGALLVAVLSALAPSDAFAGFVSGNQLVADCNAFRLCQASDCDVLDKIKHVHCLGYVTGVSDAAWRLFDARPNMSALQIAAVACNYLEDHPEEWDQDAAVLVIKALKQAFPKWR